MLLFPKIEEEEGDVPTRALLSLAKQEAKRRVSTHDAEVLDTFRSHLWDRYRVFPCDVEFDTSSAIDRIDGAVFSVDRPDLYAETDGTTIWISKIAMNFTEVVATLIHESLHDSVYVLRRTREGCRKLMSCHDEHLCMHRLGERDETTVW